MNAASLRTMIAGGARQLAGMLGVDLYQYLDDRKVLERTIFPYFAGHKDFGRVLFVGCAWYTRHYADHFPANEFWTLERDPRRQKHGSARHVVDSLENIARHFQADSLDLIFCNGLLGWGLNHEPEIELAFNACVDCLRSGGNFVLGWDDVELRRPCRPEDCASLQRMTPFIFPPLATARHLTRGACRHTYDFYVKDGLLDASQRGGLAA